MILPLRFGFSLFSFALLWAVACGTAATPEMPAAEAAGQGGAPIIASAGTGGGGEITGGGAGGAVPPSPVDIAAEAKAAAEVRCQKDLTCYGPSVYQNNSFADLDACRTRYELSYSLVWQTPGIAPDFSRIRTCGGQITTSTCDQYFTPSSLPACREKQAKEYLPDGAPCSVDGQCTRTSYCATAGNTLCGGCTPYVPENGACDAGKGCAYGTQCLNNVCARLKTPGEDCDPQANNPCLASGVVFACLDSGKCGPVLTQGAPCQQGTNQCAYGLFCNRDDTCEPTPVAAVGQPCHLFARGTINCAPGSFCKYPNNQPDSKKDGVCQAVLPDGAACSADNHFCTYPAKCVGSVCTVPKATDCR